MAYDKHSMNCSQWDELKIELLSMDLISGSRCSCNKDSDIHANSEQRLTETDPQKCAWVRIRDISPKKRYGFILFVMYEGVCPRDFLEVCGGSRVFLTREST